MNNATAISDDVPAWQKNYMKGMVAIKNGRWTEAMDILKAEPKNSPCYVLALGNSAQALIYLQRYDEAWETSNATMRAMAELDCPQPPSAIQFMRIRGEILLSNEPLA